MINQGIKADQLKTIYVESNMYSSVLGIIDKWLGENKNTIIHDITFPPMKINCGAIILYSGKTKTEPQIHPI